jgi:hypothetical protein
MPNIRIGDLISATYHGENSHDFYPQILVLHNRWARKNFPHEVAKVHGLNLNVFSEYELAVIYSVLNPDLVARYEKTKPQIAHYVRSLHQTVIKQGLDIENPLDFYTKFIRQFVKSSDGYRLYFPEKMVNVKVITKREVLMGKQQGIFSKYIKRFG